MHSLANGGIKSNEEELLSQSFEDLERLDSCSTQQDVEKAIKKYSNTLYAFIQNLRGNNNGTGKGPVVSSRRK